MIKIAILMLLGDRIKYIVLISAIAFSSLLMMQQTSIFFGVMELSAGYLYNTKASIWVVDPLVEQVTALSPLRDTDLYRVKSITGVKWAVPLLMSNVQARVYDGRSLGIVLVGVDTNSLVGVPPVILKGSLHDLWKSDAIIVDKKAIRRLSEGTNRNLDVGDVLDINDHELRIVGIAENKDSLSSAGSIYTTYDRALQTIPPTRRNLSAILVEPSAGISADSLARLIQKETGLKAYTDNDFFWSTIWWYSRNTSIPSSFTLTAFMGFIVGLAVSSQTFYSFVHENLGNFAALKAMGTSNHIIRSMLLFQAAFSGFVGFGIGCLCNVAIGSLMVWRKATFLMPWQVPVVVFCLITFICLCAAMVAIRLVNKINAAEVFRG